MSRQRRRGVTATIYKELTVEDQYGNSVTVPDPSAPITERVAFIPQRSSLASVPGQQEIDVARIILRANVEGVGAFSEVHVLGEVWDVVTPPAYHHGTRHTRHWSIDIRMRPVRGVNGQG